MKTRKKEKPSSPTPVDALVGQGIHTDLSPAERAAAGKAARARVPRELHAVWNPPSDRPDPISLLEDQAASRLPDLVPIRYGRMLASPFAFYRGAGAIMACDLASTPTSGLRVQLCGDAHLANFGGFASPERDIVFDINDFDETLPGPWEWDIKRLAASFEIAGRERGFNARQRRSITLSVVREYRRAIGEFSGMRTLDVWYALLDAAKIQSRWGLPGQQKSLKKLETQFRTHDNMHAVEKLTHRVGGQLRIIAHPPLVVPIEDLSQADFDSASFIENIRTYINAYSKTLPDDRRHLLEQFHFVDMARKVVGVGSVGLRNWIVLLSGGDDGDLLFLQIKEAQKSVLEAYLSKSEFTDSGKRVVDGQRLMQTASDILLGWEHVPEGEDHLPRDFYVRQLWDWKISADLETMLPAEMTVYAEMCGWTLARAHARSGDRIALSAYLGKSDAFDQALADFAAAYADQNEDDYQALVAAVQHQRIKAQTGI